MIENNDDGLTSRQGASFDVLITTYTTIQSRQASTERKPHVKRIPDRRSSDGNVSWYKDTIVC